ncbi:hypothetical protein [Streptomyces sp. NL15-2K]|uniref:hypothetical protein n=1 Tax=Streptomyces sp. NL15-2K TaxID=376149 RepID=UPI000F58C4A4|nr:MULTISPECIES: hypothetical protein [Actinomycetes]WKX10239.1 hypothetical protein Q4V64_23135 [Kutzneria buriramensis]GCB48264.1 hypothetical protein SNL152K_5588 [Streptomyces sp. NL15-2K]
MASPRVLRLTFEFHVPEGLNANIRFARIEKAAASLTAGIQALASTAFPWADRLVVRKEWSYQWWAPEADEIPLPPSDSNTVSNDVPEPATTAKE